jgi:acyl-CoA thioester hydrolase
VVEHTERVRVGWIGTDAGERIHFTAAFRRSELAETGLYRKLGLLEGGRADYPRRRVEAEYLRVLVFEDEVDVTIRVDKVGHTSIRFVWEGVHDGEVAVTGAFTIVHVNEDGKPARIGDEERALLTA